MKYLIIGASSGLGRELAYEYAKNKHDLVLVARDLRDLAAIKSDLEKKSEIKVEIIELDLSSESEIEKNLFVERFFNQIDGILFPIGMMFGDDKIEMLNHHNEGDQIEVSFNLSSREYNGRYFHNIDAWRIENRNSGTDESSVDIPEFNANEKEDDLPF